MSAPCRAPPRAGAVESRTARPPGQACRAAVFFTHVGGTSPKRLRRLSSHRDLRPTCGEFRDANGSLLSSRQNDLVDGAEAVGSALRGHAEQRLRFLVENYAGLREESIAAGAGKIVHIAF